MDKNIADIIKIVRGRIEDIDKIKLRKIDTIVNAANPTLMGSDQGVDKSIHDAVYRLSGDGRTFAEKIYEELEKANKKDDRAETNIISEECEVSAASTVTGSCSIPDNEKNVIRCNRGEAVKTSGYGLCQNIIHVVGSKCDGKSESSIDCSSSRINILESCYYQIIRIVRENAGIKNIAVPIIGAGDYGFPFPLAVKIALASIGNALVEWKNEDEELFEMRELENIYFYIYDENPKECRKNEKLANEIWGKYRLSFRNDGKVVFQNSFFAHVRYMNEIIRYDRKRGYFAAARKIRILLMAVRFLFMPYMLVKDMGGKVDWEKRRNVVEGFALVKALCPVVFFLVWHYGLFAQFPWVRMILFPIIIVYGISDTITYLLTLIIMADIQRPSANIIRSLIMLLVNYAEVSVGIAYLYFVYYRDRVALSLSEAVRFGILGMASNKVKMNYWIDDVFLYTGVTIRFFFASLVFGYFANHMKQRKFRS